MEVFALTHSTIGLWCRQRSHELHTPDTCKERRWFTGRFPHNLEHTFREHCCEITSFDVLEAPWSHENFTKIERPSCSSSRNPLQGIKRHWCKQNDFSIQNMLVCVYYAHDQQARVETCGMTKLSDRLSPLWNDENEVRLSRLRIVPLAYLQTCAYKCTKFNRPYGESGASAVNKPSQKYLFFGAWQLPTRFEKVRHTKRDRVRNLFLHEMFCAVFWYLFHYKSTKLFILPFL